jgi:hypothetical protein
MLARNPLSLTTLIAWLQTKNPAEFYAFSDLCGKCLFSQYLTSMGFNPEPTSEYTFDTWALHLYFGEVASMKPFTFGAALERAKRLDACSNNN